MSPLESAPFRTWHTWECILTFQNISGYQGTSSRRFQPHQFLYFLEWVCPKGEPHQFTWLIKTIKPWSHVNIFGFAIVQHREPLLPWRKQLTTAAAPRAVLGPRTLPEFHGSKIPVLAALPGFFCDALRNEISWVFLGRSCFLRFEKPSVSRSSCFFRGFQESANKINKPPSV